MECTDFVHDKLLHAHGDPAEHAEFSAHLATCNGCQADLRDLRAISDQYHRESAEKLPEGVRARVLDLRSEIRGVSPWQRWSLRLAAAAILGAFIIPYVLRSGPKTGRPVATAPATDMTFGFDSWNASEPAIDTPPPPPAPPRTPTLDSTIESLKSQIPVLDDERW